MSTTLDAILAVVLRTSWQVVPVVLLVWLTLRLVGDRMNPVWRHRLWWLVVVRLALPALPSSPLAPVPWDHLHTSWTERAQPFEEAVPAHEEPWQVPEAWLADAPARTEVARDAERRHVAGRDRSADAPEGAARPTGAGTEDAIAATLDEPRRPRETREIGPSAFGGIDTRSARRPIEPSAGTPAGPSASPNWWSLAWLLGAVAFALRATLGELSFRRALRASRPVEDPRALAVLESARSALGLRRPVRLLETDRVDVPATASLVRPCVLVPPGIASRFDERELRRLFLHELSHVRHHDVLANVLFVALRTVFWFHPLVHLALRRLVAEREAARDWDALRHEPEGVAPTHYARTLLRLLEERLSGRTSPTAVPFLPRKRDLQRRIVMITRFRPADPRRSAGQAALGGSLLASLALLGLASATGAPLAPANGEPSTPQDGERIAVQSRGTLPAWRTELEARLSKPIQAPTAGITLARALDELFERTGINFVLDEDARGFSDRVPRLSSEYRANGNGTLSTKACLRALLEGLDSELDYALDSGMVRIGMRWELPRPLQVRLYDAAPLIAAYVGDEDEDPAEWLADSLPELITEFTGEGGEHWWSYEGPSLRVWNELLLINQTPGVHAEVEGLLNLFLRREGGSDAGASPTADLSSALVEPVDLQIAGSELARLPDLLFDRFGVRARVSDNHDHEVEVDLRGIQLGHALEWVATSAGVRLSFDGDTVCFGSLGRLETAVFEVRDLLRMDDPEADLGDEYDQLTEVVMENVDPASWHEYEGPRLNFWGSLMVVRQTPQNLTATGSLLDDLRAFTHR